MKRRPWLLLSIPFAVEQYFPVPPPLANHSDVCTSHGQGSVAPAPPLGVLRLQRRLLPALLLSLFFHLGLFLFAAHGLRLEITPQGDGGRLGGAGSVLVIGSTLGCHDLLYFLLIFCYSCANLSDGPNVLT